MNCMTTLIASLAVASLLAACAPASRVILLPESNGEPTAVEVKTVTASQVLSVPYQTASVNKSGDLAFGTTDSKSVQERFGSLLAEKPPAAEHFLLYFEPGGAKLTDQSSALLPAIITNAQARKGGEIVVIGHTDKVGSLDANDALSLQRAKSVRQLFVARGFKPDLVEAVGRGERAPLVATEDEVNEPQNRRAEVIVR